MYFTITEGLYLFSPFLGIVVIGALVGLINTIRNN